MNIEFIGCFTLVSTGITGQAATQWLLCLGYNAWGDVCDAPRTYKLLPVLIKFVYSVTNNVNIITMKW